MIQTCPHCGERIAKPKRKRIRQTLLGPIRKEAREAKRQRHREETAAIRNMVWVRAAGQCEAWIPELSASENPRGDRCQHTAMVLDHWLGGVGRRRQQQTVGTTWALCKDHNDARTANYPNSSWWNVSRELHCLFRGLRFVPHIERASSSPRGDARPQEKP